MGGLVFSRCFVGFYLSLIMEFKVSFMVFVFEKEVLCLYERIVARKFFTSLFKEVSTFGIS